MFYLYTEVKEAFIIYGPGGGGGEPEGGAKNFTTYSPGGGGGATFFSILFGRGDFFFRKNYITCILILVGALQQHKGMFLKHGRGGAKILSCSVMEGGQFFSRVFSKGGGGGALFFGLLILPNHHPPSGHK